MQKTRHSHVNADIVPASPATGGQFSSPLHQGGG